APPPRPGATAADRLRVAVETAQTAESSGHPDKAIENWKLVLRQDANHAEARAALVRLYTAAARWNNLVELHRQELEALGGARPGAEAGPHKDRKLELLREMVVLYRDRMNLEPMVVQTYNAILALEPSDAGALAALAVSYEKLGRHTDVIKVLESQAEHAAAPSEKIALLKRIAGIWLDRFNNVNNATRPLEQLLAIDPANNEAIAQLKDLYTRRRAWRQLFEVSRREADLLGGPARRDAVVELARLAAEKLGAAGEAVALWREALSLDPSTAGALDALEKLTEREKDYQGLAEVLERRVGETADAEQKVAVLMKLGAVYGERLEDNERSIDAWRRVLAVKPGHPKAMRVLRDAYTQAGAWDTLEALFAASGDFEGLAEVLGGAADRAQDPDTRVQLSFRAARIYEGRLKAPERAFRSYERVLSVDPRNLQAATALVPIYLKEEKWARLAQLYEVLLDALPAEDVAGQLDHLQKLRELASARLSDRVGAFRWAHRAYRLEPTSADLEATLERTAADAGAWKELVATFDARAAETADTVERARLRDKAALVEADRLQRIDNAIARYTQALAETPDDEAVVSTLDRLLRRGERWAQLRSLYDHRLSRTPSGAARRALLDEVARLEEESLKDPDAASGRFRTILEESPDDAAALESLSRLAEAAGRWPELAGLLSRRRDAAAGPARAALAFKLGSLQGERLGDTERALASFEEVLSLVAHHPGALAALEALLRSDRWRVTAATMLEPEFEAVGEHRKLAWVLQILLDTAEDAARRRALALRLARVYGDRLEDNRSGFELVRSVLEQQPASDELADEFAALALQGGWNDELAQALAHIVDREGLDPAVRVRLARRTAAIYEDRHGNAEAAERFHKLVLDAGDLDVHAFNALKRFYQERERWADLRALYATWVARTPEVPARVELLVEEAVLLEEILEQPADAAGVYAQILALDERNRTATRALDRLYTRLERWADLSALFTRTVELGIATGEEARELVFRRGEVREQRLGDASGALEDFEAVVLEQGGHAGARAGLERLVGHPTLRRRAAAVLEPRYESDGDVGAANLVRMLLVRLEGTEDAVGRAELYRRVAELRELVLDDTPGAFDAVVEALLAQPLSEVFRSELLRLAAAAGQDERASGALERAVEAVAEDEARVPLLRDLAALYDDRLADHGRAERTYRRLLSAAGQDLEVLLHAAVALERLYRGLQNPRGLVEALELRARHELDQELRRSLFAQAGEILEEELGDLAGAVRAQRERLELEHTDRAALAALARLYAKTEAWGDLVATLRKDAHLAADGEEQKALQLRAADVLESRLADVSGAIALYGDVLMAFGADRAVHAALARLYELSDAWTELLQILEQDLAVATEAADRLGLIVRAAELRRLRTRELPRAVEGYREALDLDPSQPTARAALVSLLGSTEAGVPLAAARALDQVLQAEQSWDRLVEVLDRVAADTDDVEERRRALARAAEVCEIGLNDAGRAFEYAARELRESLGEPELRPRLAQVERLARTAGRHADLARVLREVAPELLDSDLQLEVFMNVASLARGPLGDPAMAREYYEKALEQRRDYLPALDALETLHEEGRAFGALIEVLRLKTDLAVSDDERRALWRKQAKITEDELRDRASAARAHEAILGLGFDREAAQALERIYDAEARWEDLASLLESQLTIDGADVVDLHFRLGVVSMRHLDNPDRALDHFREVLDRAPDHDPTVQALEALGARDGYAARTAAMLEPIYRARGNLPRLILALEARIAAEDDVVGRKALLASLAQLYEDSLDDKARALDTWARVFAEELGDRGAWDELSRLAGALGRYDRQAEIYARALEASTGDDDVVAELAFQTARLFDDRVGDSARARRYYRRALAFDPGRAEVFDAFEALLTRERAWPELLELYRDAADRAADVDARKAYLFKIADIDESAQGDLPKAIEDYRAILEVDPGDARAVERLDALLVRTAAWRDLAELLERRVNDAVDSEERAGLRFRLGRLRVERLEDPRGAVEAFREILDERRDYRPAIEALEDIAATQEPLRLSTVEILEPLYRDLDDWQKLINVLGVRLEATRDPVDRGGLLREIGRLRETRAKDVRAAYGAYGQAFAADPGDGEAREAVERLASEHDLWDALVDTYEGALAATDDAVLRADLVRAVAVTHDHRRGDPRAAIIAYNRLFAMDDTQLDVLEQLKDLHVLLSDWAGFVEVLERKVARSLDDQERRRLLHTIGETHRDMLGQNDAAVDAWKRALESDPGDVDALDALDGLYAARGDARALAQVLSQRLEIEGDPELRRQTALRLGKLWNTELKDPQQAIDAYRRALDDEPGNREAILALEDLYARQELHAELLENLRKQVELCAEEGQKNPLRLRIGRLLAEHLTDPDGALDTYREMLAVDPTHAEAIAAVRSLAEAPEQRATAVEILEPIFRGSERWDDLVATLELKLTSLEEPARRLQELRALAAVHEDGRGDPGAAFDAYRRAFREDGADKTTLEDLERLGASLDRWADVATLLEQQSLEVTDPLVSRDLSVRAAQLAADHLGDDRRATASYRRALEQGGDEDGTLEPLDAIYSRTSQWQNLVEILERRVAIASDPELLDRLEVRIGELREQRFEEPRGALAAYRSVADRTPTHEAALAGLERLLGSPEVRADALDVLEACFQRNDDARKLAWLLELRVQGAELPSDRIRLWTDLARLREDRLQDVSGAFDAVVAAFRQDPRDEALVAEIERLAPAAAAWSRLRNIAEAALAEHPDLGPTDVAQLNLRAARWYRDHLEDVAAAEARLRAALAADDQNAEALELLEGLHRAEGREADLVTTLRMRADLELDVDARKRMLREAAELAEARLLDVDRAAELTAGLLDVDDSDTAALDTLARLRKAQGRHAEVAELLARRARLADDPAQAAALRREVAGLYAGPIGDVDRAVLAWKELLDFDPNDLGAREALEGIFERAERWKDLEEALRGRMDVAVSAEERAVTRLRLASLAEERFHNRRDAVEFLREVLDELPTHAEAGQRLERLYALDARWSDLSELLERRAEDLAAAGDTQAELATLVRIGELNERELRDTARAVELYERVLARDGDHLGALRALARLHEAAEQWGRAAEMVRRALALATPGAEGAALALALAQLEADRMHNPGETERALRRALELDPTCRAALDRLKAIAQGRGDHALLVEMLEREVALATDAKATVALYKSLAEAARAQLSDPPRAARYLEAAVALAPEDRELLLPLVELYGEVGRDRDAVPILERIVQSYGTRRTKDMAQWLHRLGRAHEALGELPQALTSYDAAFKIDLTNVPILRDLGLLCLKTEDLERAQKTFRALLLQRLDGTAGITKADVYFYLGSTLSQQGDKTKALGMLDRALEADKAHARALELTARLKA
ncbi:MAG: hypothetical protein HY909_08450, partial [Deltaproteobacteria bacterium]|nr:hypothetical protein [Deltaproteobacteria bacterium]